MTKSNKKGTSLVELLAVIVIMGIIAAIAVPSVGALISNSKKNAAVQSANVVLSSAKTALTAAQATGAGDTTVQKETFDHKDVYYTTAKKLKAGKYIESNPFGDAESDPDVFFVLSEGTVYIQSAAPTAVVSTNVTTTFDCDGQAVKATSTTDSTFTA